MKNAHILPPKSRTGLKGVYIAPKQSRKPYRAQITNPHNGQKVFLGYFNTKKEAGEAYDEAVWKFYGPVAYYNFLIVSQSTDG